MILLHGVPRNLQKPVIGKISLSLMNPDKRSETIAINPTLSKVAQMNYCALLFSNENEFEKTKNIIVPTIYLAKEDIETLTDGDVIELLPNGRITILFQVNSRHNIIFATSKCNSRCIMCPQPVDNNEGQLTERNLRLISLIDKSTRELAITGGEPTVIGNDLFRLILACKELLPNTSLLLLTNARRFHDFNYAHFYSSIQHPSITVGTALYGDNNLEHDFIVGAEGAFNETVKGILNLAAFGNQIEIRIVINKFTYQRLTRIAEFVYRNMTFVSHIAFMGLEPIGLARDNLSSLWVDPEDVVKSLEKAVHHLTQRDMNVSIYNVPLCLLPERIWKYARQSISDWKNSFDSKCLLCTVKDNCSGLFESGIKIYKNYLKPVC